MRFCYHARCHGAAGHAAVRRWLSCRRRLQNTSTSGRKSCRKARRETSAQAPAEWSKQEIELAQARCTAMLKGLDVVAVPDAPIREGTECGTPAPMRLVSIGSNPQIAFSPPPALTCDMIAALHQLAAARCAAAGAQAPGSPGRQRGDHEFLLLPQRLRPQERPPERARPGQRARHRRVRHRQGADDHGRCRLGSDRSRDRGAGCRSPETAGSRSRGCCSQAEEWRPAGAGACDRSPPSSPSVPALASTCRALPCRSREPAAPTALGLTAAEPPGRAQTARRRCPTRLPAAEPLTGKAQFLRAAHRAACGIFGTVLGPEANSAHKNHFHVDMAERKVRSICE